MSEISVRAALAKGRSEVVFPAFVSVFVVIAAIMICMVVSPSPFITGMCLTPFLFLIPAVIHSQKSPSWKIWAFEHVRNVHELKKKAVHEGILISWLNVFQSLSHEQKLALQRIEQKFSIPDAFPEDYRIQTVVEIYFNKSYNLVEAVLYTIVASLTLGLMVIAFSFDGGISLLLFLPLFFFVPMIIYNLDQYCAVKPPLVFSDDGLLIRSTFMHKTRIADVNVGLNRKMGRVTANIVGSWMEVSINIADLDTPAAKLAEIAEVFKRRWRTDEKQQESNKETGKERYLK
jgi:hypothetical protein